VGGGGGGGVRLRVVTRKAGHPPSRKGKGRETANTGMGGFAVCRVFGIGT